MALKRAILIVACLLGARVAQAQTFITVTTLAAAVTSSQTSILVTSASGAWIVGNYAYVDYEVMRITNVSGTLIGVTRQQFGTRAITHASGQAILAGAGGHFLSMAASGHAPPIASCVRASQAYLPLVDYTSGNIWTCDASGFWRGTNTAKLTYNSLTTQ